MVKLVLQLKQESLPNLNNRKLKMFKLNLQSQNPKRRHKRQALHQKKQMKNLKLQKNQNLQNLQMINQPPRLLKNIRKQLLNWILY